MITSKTCINNEIDWINDIPKDFSIYKIKNIGNFTTSSINKKTNPDEKKVYLVNYMDIYKNNHNHTLFNREYMAVSANESQIQSSDLKKGDVLFTPSSETIEDIGLSAVVLEDLKNTFFSYHILRLRFYKDINLKFKKYLFNNYFVYNQFSSLACGTTRMTLKINKFKNTFIILPDQQKQEYIANYLDEKSEIIDNIIYSKKKLIKLLEEQKQALIYEVVTKGINKEQKLKVSGIDWIGKIPIDWQLTRLKYCVLEIVGGGTPNTSNDSFWDDDGIPWVTINDLNSSNNGINYTKRRISIKGKEEKNLPLIKKGTIVYTIFASLGDCSILNIDAALNQAIVGVIPNNKIKNRYMYYFFKMLKKDVLYFASLNTQYNLNLEKIRSYILPQPSLTDQEQIVDYLDKKVYELDNTINKYKKQINLYKEYKEALIFEAVTGKMKIGE